MNHLKTRQFILHQPRNRRAIGPISIDKLEPCRYLALNSASHASASACAPGGTFFARIPHKFEPLAGRI
jgi:hypothetical protein